MSVNVRWREIYQGFQMREAVRDLPAESLADARDGAVGALVEFASSTVATHSMNWRIDRELNTLSWVAHARLRTHALRTRRNDRACLAVVIYAVTEMPFTGQRSYRFLQCDLWGDTWTDAREAVRNHNRTDRAEPRFGQNPNEHRFFWGTIA